MRKFNHPILDVKPLWKKRLSDRDCQPLKMTVFEIFPLIQLFSINSQTDD